MYQGQVPCKGQTPKQGSICSMNTNMGAKGNSSLNNVVGNDGSESSPPRDNSVGRGSVLGHT